MTTSGNESTINAVAEVTKAFSTLSGQPLQAPVKHLVDVTYSAYATKTRVFHNQGHCADVTVLPPTFAGDYFDHHVATERRDEMRNLLKISGFFHDVIYAKVDGGIADTLREKLTTYGTFDTNTLSFTIAKEGLTPLQQGVLKLYGFTPGQQVEPLGKGMNEFLSAVVALDAMRDAGLSEKQQLKVASIIEATFPFKGQEFIATRAERLKEASALLSEKALSPDEQKETIKAGIAMASRDVGNFIGGSPLPDKSEHDRIGVLVRGSWRLLPENSLVMRDRNYAPQDYTRSIQGMAEFLSLPFLKPQNLYHHYEGFPPDAQLRTMHQLAQQTIDGEKLYNRTKIVEAAFLESLEGVTRAPGESPTALPDFVAKLDVRKLEKKLPELKTETERAVYSLLSEGRGEAMSYDAFASGKSPIAAFLAERVGVTELAKLGDEISKKLSAPPNTAESRQHAYPEIITSVINALGAHHTSQIVAALRQGQTPDRLRALDMFANDHQLGNFKA
jgi:hypothetical protein